MKRDPLDELLAATLAGLSPSQRAELDREAGRISWLRREAASAGYDLAAPLCAGHSHNDDRQAPLDI